MKRYHISLRRAQNKYLQISMNVSAEQDIAKENKTDLCNAVIY